MPAKLKEKDARPKTKIPPHEAAYRRGFLQGLDMAINAIERGAKRPQFDSWFREVTAWRDGRVPQTEPPTCPR